MGDGTETGQGSCDRQWRECDEARGGLVTVSYTLSGLYPQGALREAQGFMRPAD